MENLGCSAAGAPRVYTKGLTLAQLETTATKPQHSLLVLNTVLLQHPAMLNCTAVSGSTPLKSALNFKRTKETHILSSETKYETEHQLVHLC